MNISDVNELQDFIDADIGWRKKELTEIKSLVVLSKNCSKELAIRSGITMIYAHWEGAIKNIATYYLCYISKLNIPYYKLKHNFFAIALKGELRSKGDLQNIEKSGKILLHMDLITFIFGKHLHNSQIPYNDIIDTKSNLNSKVFQEIMNVIGLSDDSYSGSFKLIDTILEFRNQIAHGDEFKVKSLDEQRFLEMHETIVTLIELFSVQIFESAQNNDFLIDISV